MGSKLTVSIMPNSTILPKNQSVKWERVHRENKFFHEKNKRTKKNPTAVVH